MSKDEKDMESDGRLHDGYQYKIKMDDGTTDYLRDHDDIVAVRARLVRAQSVLIPGDQDVEKARALSLVDFSGARDLEDGNEIGPVRGKGFVDASRVIGVGYTELDGTQASQMAYESCAAFFDVQRAAVAQQIKDQVDLAQRQQQPVEEPTPGKNADAAADALVGG